MPFQPGEVSNPTGKSGWSSKPWADALKLAIAEAHAAGGTKLRALAEKTVDEGLAGNMAAIKEIGDRLDGRPPQTIAHQGGDPNQPILFATGVPRSEDFTK